MFKKILITTSIILLLNSSFREPVSYFNISKGYIGFKSDAKLELIKASSEDMKGLIESDKKEFTFIVRIKTFKGFNTSLQREHFNENYLESGKYPDATFTGKIIEDVDFTKNNTFTVRAKGLLTVHGVSQERIIKSDMTIRNGVISIKANFTVALADHNIPIPRVVHEKLASEIKIDVNAELKPK